MCSWCCGVIFVSYARGLGFETKFFTHIFDKFLQNSFRENSIVFSPAYCSRLFERETTTPTVINFARFIPPHGLYSTKHKV